MPNRFIVQLSGGAASYAAARLIVDEHGPADVTLLFADTKVEDPDLYRFLDDVERRLNIPITRLCEGRTPWEVFFDEGMIGNTRVDPCSKILKRQILRAWLEENATPDEAVVVIGYDANEEHRFGPLQERYKPWRVRAPLIEHGLFKEQTFGILAADGLVAPKLYAVGFQHNNCGGRCIKGGQAQWALLLDHYPDRYDEDERNEEEFRRRTGKDVSILRDRRGGKTKPLTLRQFRQWRESEPSLIDWLEWGGCSCMEPT